MAKPLRLVLHAARRCGSHVRTSRCDEFARRRSSELAATFTCEGGRAGRWGYNGGADCYLCPAASECWEVDREKIWRSNSEKRSVPGGSVDDVAERSVEGQRGSGYELVTQAACKVNRNAGSQRAVPCGAI